ncbi:hypothetical protein Tco_0392408 [Tanacetum coccineum]
MSAMGELTFFLGLQVQQRPNGIFINQDKYVQEILKKFDLECVRTATTPYEALKPKSKNEPDSPVNEHLYRSMIGSLMYLTASRPDIIYAVSACSRNQVTPTTSNLEAVKKIFKYLKGQPKLGLWYPRESPFVLEAYSDSDYAGANKDRKSITSGCQFLGRRLLSWQCKKQTIVATSSTEAEYVAAANCCGRVLWIQNQLLDYGGGFESPTHIEIPESCLPLRKRVRFASPIPSHEVGESSAAGAARQDKHAIARDDPYSIAREDLYGFVYMVDVPPRCLTSRELDYDITDTWDDLIGAIDEIAPTTLEGVNQRVTDLATIVEQETTSMYGIMEDAQDDRSQLRGRVNLLYRDRPVHRRLAVMIEREAKMAREAWGLSMDASDYARSDVMSLRTTVVAHSALISKLQSEITRRHRCEVLEQSNDPRKVGNSTMHQQRLVAFLDFGYVVAMLCKPVKYYGLFPASKLYMNLFVFVSYQYRSFVQYYLLSTAY